MHVQSETYSFFEAVVRVSKYGTQKNEYSWALNVNDRF